MYGGNKTISLNSLDFQTVKFANLENMENVSDKTGVGLLGYAVDKGVENNKGRIGVKEGSRYHKT